MPQPPPVLHEAEDVEPNEKLLEPIPLEANFEIFFFTCVEPQTGQVTSSTALELRTSSSKSLSQVVHTNSNNGILFSSV